MKKVSFVLVLVVMMLSSFKKADNCTLSYNGIYAFKLDEEHSAVLRFYEDGTVLASTSVNDYMDVFTWFHKDNKDMVLTGKYKIKKCEIKFEVKGITGSQSYEGTIIGNSIDVKLKDEETKKSVSRIYTFYAL